jgi:hypothetical protein
MKMLERRAIAAILPRDFFSQKKQLTPDKVLAG